VREYHGGLGKGQGEWVGKCKPQEERKNVTRPAPRTQYHQQENRAREGTFLVLSGEMGEGGGGRGGRNAKPGRLDPKRKQ